MDQSEQKYDYLLRKIDEFIRKYYLNKVVRGSIYATAILLLAYLFTFLTGYFGNPPIGLKTVLFFLFIALMVIVLIGMIGIPLISYLRLGKQISNEQAATIIGTHFTDVKDKLLNTLQLKKLADHDLAGKDLIEASINQKIEELRPVPFKSAIRINENKKYLKYALLPLAVILIIAFAAPSILKEGTENMVKYNKLVPRKAPFQFVLQNRSLDAVQGSDLALDLKMTGNDIPQDIYIEDGVNTYKLEKQSIIRFKYLFHNLQQNKKFRFVAAGFSSDSYEIKIKPKPLLLSFDVELNYPAYLKRKNELLSNAGDMTIPAGTTLKWKFNTQNSSSIVMTIDKKAHVLHSPNNKDFSYAARIMNSTSYSLLPKNDFVAHADSVAYSITTIADQAPTISLSEKPDSLNTNAIYFMGKVSDDHGFTALRFNYRVLDDKDKTKLISKQISIDNNAIENNFFYYWNLAQTGIKPGQQLEYYFEVWDNDGVNGPKSSRSTIKTFKLPGEKEMSQKQEENAQSIKQKMNSAIKLAAQIEKEAKRLNQDLLNKKALSFEEKKQVEQLMNKQKQLQEQVKDIQQSNKKNQEEQQAFKEQDKAIAEKQQQIEQLFNNVLDEKTKDLLKKLQDLLEQNNKNSTQDELSKMQMDNKTLKNELDRVLELYKQLEFDQKLKENIDQLNKLANKEKQLSEQSKDKKSNLDNVKKDQNQLNKDFKDLKEQLKTLEEKNEQLETKNPFNNPKEAQQQIEQQMQQSSEQLDKKDGKKAADKQQKAAEQMQQMAQKLEEMQQAGEEKESKVNMQELKQLLKNLLSSSFDQERVMLAFKNTAPSDPKYTGLAQNQRLIKDNMKMIADSLYSLSRRVPQIESAVNKEVNEINFNIEKALESLSDRHTPEANRNQQYAMTSMNNLALMLNEALEQMQNQQRNSSGKGKGQKKSKQSLSQLSKMQEQLNKNMQKAKEELQRQGNQGKVPKGQMSEEFARMAQQQQQIRRGLQQIDREQNKDGKGKMGNLDKVMKDMEQTEVDLLNKRLQEQSLVRQKDILSKMLDAEKAEREQDLDSKRESREGKDLSPEHKLQFQEYEKLKMRETELIKTVPPSLYPFYKGKVTDYFKQINNNKPKSAN